MGENLVTLLSIQLAGARFSDDDGGKKLNCIFCIFCIFDPAQKMAPSRQLKLELGSEALLRPGLPDGLIKTKHPNLGIFGGPWNGKCWYRLRPVGKMIMTIGIIHGRLV
jgi:hypothetical protein